ncbi:MAG: HAD family hydrolase [Candidatus Sericytochromatia bacterium]|nr:HAD family hydrolase [Candidatus Sericytochromatia bacterium]
MKPARAVFLDRDGTINVEAGYIRELDNLRLAPGAAAAIKRLNEAGILAIVVTNQSGPARGYYAESWIDCLHERLVDLLKAEGAFLDDIFYCPHLPDGIVPEYSFACACRKPEPGMLLAAADKFQLDPQFSYMIGDKATDVEVGQRVKSRTVLLRSGYGEQVLAGAYQWPCRPDHIADDLEAAIEWVFQDIAAPPRV